MTRYKNTRLLWVAFIITLCFAWAFQVNVHAESKYDEDSITGIDYKLETPLEFEEGTNGWLNTDWDNGNFYFRYRESSVEREGATLTLHTTEDGDVDYAFVPVEDDDPYFANINDENDIIYWGEIYTYSDQSYENQWKANKQYNVEVSYKNFSTNVPVSIVESQVESISFKPGEIQLMEGVNGYTDTVYDDENNPTEYFKYDYENQIYSGDSVLTVNYKNGEQKTYDCEDWSFVNIEDDSDYLSLNIYDDQVSNHWDLDNPGEITLYYRGRETTIKAEIVENPVESISFSPDTIELVDHCDGDINWGYDEDTGEEIEYFSYDCWSKIASKEAVLTLTYTNGEEKEYKYDPGEETFVNTEDDTDSVDLYCEA